MKRIAMAALLALAPATVSAQSTAELLAQGIKAYEAFNVEGARPIFAQIISPSYLNKVTQEEKVLAYKYLGASFAVLTQTDSAQRYFQAALDFDPFTDLDPVKFSQAELGPFGVAKTKIFKVGMRPVTPQVVNPRADSTYYQFSIVTTHSATVTINLVRQNAPNAIPEVIYNSRNDGPKTIPWDGRLKTKGGAVADSGTYLLTITANSSIISGQTATESQLLRIEQSYEPLEEPLPELPASMLLPEKIEASEPWLDLTKGVLIGAASYLLPMMILKSDTVLSSGGFNWKPHAVIGISIGVASGAGSFFFRKSRREISANVTENARRKQQRNNYNAAINARNVARLGDMLLIITPLTVR